MTRPFGKIARCMLAALFPFIAPLCPRAGAASPSTGNGVGMPMEAFNVFNRAQFGNPQANLSSPLSFGVITTPVNQGATGSGTPRQFQLALRLSF